MNKVYFDARPEQLECVNRKKNLWHVNTNVASEEVNDFESESVHTQWTADQVELTFERESDALGVVKVYENEQIAAYDSSSAVNEFSINGIAMWLDRNDRACLKNRIESEKVVGKTNTTLWFGGHSVTLGVDEALVILAQLEVYASACYDVTQQHYNAVAAIDTIDEVLNYDFTVGYPEKLSF